MNRKTFVIGQRVQYRSGGSWKPEGVIIEAEEPITMNDATLISAHYKVRWDNGDETDWLSAGSLVEVTSK